MTTNTNAALIKILEGLSDRAYCDYIAKMRTNECLGWEEKVRTSKFGQAELNAHAKAGELLGRHRAFAEAAAAASSATPAPIGADALRVAAQAALTALENLHEIDTETECITIDVRDEIDALRAAIDAAKEQA